MRYLTGFIGGLVAGVLLLIFQEFLISGERETAEPAPVPQITLSTPRVSKPPEPKRYEPKETPQPPREVDKPSTPSDPVRTLPPERPALTTLDGRGYIESGRGPGVDTRRPGLVDGHAVPMITVAPRYPADALRANLEGDVEVEFTILPDGSVTDVRIIHANPRGVFEQEAKRAVLRWKFKPKVEDGRAESMRVRQLIEFRLPAE